MFSSSLVPVANPSTWSVTFHVDSGTGQSMCSCSLFALAPSKLLVFLDPSRFLESALPFFLVYGADGDPVVVLIHDCFLSQRSSINLLSVSQFQSDGVNTVDFLVGSPALSLRSVSS